MLPGPYCGGVRSHRGGHFFAAGFADSAVVVVGAAVGRPVTLMIAWGRSIVCVMHSSEKKTDHVLSESVPANPILVMIASRITARP